MAAVVVRMRHVRAAGLCASGARSWCQRHDFDWTVFLTEGVAAEEVTSRGCALADRVVAVARQEAEGGE